MRRKALRPPAIFLAAALLAASMTACGAPAGESAAAQPSPTPRPTREPVPAARVVDAASFSRQAVDMLDPGREFDWLQQVSIPKLETDAPSAAQDSFNADIWEAYRGPLEKLEAGEEGNALYKIYYESSVTNGVVGILVHNTAGWQYSETVSAADGYYFDLEADSPITAAEYVARCGGDWDTLRAQAVEEILGMSDYQDSRDVTAGDAVLFNGEGYQVEVTGVFSVSDYPWTAFCRIDA